MGNRASPHRILPGSRLRLQVKIVLISPRVLIKKGDFLGSGVPYWPVEMAILASFLRDQGTEVTVIDLFGSSPGSIEEREDHYLQGISLRHFLASSAFQNAELFMLFAISYLAHQENLDICQAIKGRFPETPIAILENSQAVTGYALSGVANEFFSAGAKFLLCGDVYWNWVEIVNCLVSPEVNCIPKNIISHNEPQNAQHVQREINPSVTLPAPAWDLFPIKNYWALPYSHGPKTATYFPIMTSRGCPGTCSFCVGPGMNECTWRPRSPKEVADEMVFLKQKFCVRDFQIEDLNPVVDRNRWREICHEIISRNADVRFYFASGVKAECLNILDIPLLAKAGCRYISISPETGSQKLNSTMKKHFDFEHGLSIVDSCHKNGIFTQACFLIGHPAETSSDFDSTCTYLKRLTQKGLDEVAVFSVAPIAGSALFLNLIPGKFESRCLSFGPQGRFNSKLLMKKQRRLIRIFVLYRFQKLFSFVSQCLRIVVKSPKTKLENLPWKIIYLKTLILSKKILSFRKVSRRILTGVQLSH